MGGKPPSVPEIFRKKSLEIKIFGNGKPRSGSGRTRENPCSRKEFSVWNPFCPKTPSFGVPGGPPQNARPMEGRFLQILYVEGACPILADFQVGLGNLAQRF
jgi:hypothetical protein